jgi:hypothetical protein
MPQSSRPLLATLLSAVLVGCDSTSPASDRLLQVRGGVLLEGQAPTPPLDVEIQAWPTAEGDSDSVATDRTDEAGLYTADLGPFPSPMVDSLRVRVTQYDCGLQTATDLRRRDVALDGGALVLPTLGLSYRLQAAQFSTAAAACAAIVTPLSPGLVGDYARLALWVDDISDSVRGRWRLNHSASIGDDYGYFSGSFEGERILLQLRPTQPTPCSGLQLDIPVGGDNGSTLDAADLVGDGSCSVPSTTVRFFQGAELTELLPPEVH